MLLVLVVDLSAEYVEARAGACVVGGGGLIKGDFGGSEFRLYGIDAGGIGYGEQVGVADGEDDEVAGVLRGETGAGEVVLGREVVLEGGDVDKVLGEVGAEVDDLKGSDDWLDAGEFEAEGGEVDLLDLDAGVGGGGGKQGLKLFEALTVGVLLGGGLEEEAKVLAEAALDGIVEGEIKDCSGGLAVDDAAFEGVRGGLGSVLSGGGVELLLPTGDGGAVCWSTGAGGGPCDGGGGLDGIGGLSGRGCDAEEGGRQQGEAAERWTHDFTLAHTIDGKCPLG